MRASAGEQRRLAAAHAYARERGASRRMYACARAIAGVLLRARFRLRVTGTERVPVEGPAIITPNHKDFLDPVLIGVASPRPVRFMAMAELFKAPLGRLVVRLGAFPVRRGGSDAEALETARAVLAHGEVLVVFPEGRLIQDIDRLGSPHHGAARLALDGGAPLVPTAIAGTARLWRRPLLPRAHVQVTFLPAVAPHAVTTSAKAVWELMDERAWPAVAEEYDRLRARPTWIGAGLAALATGAGVLVWLRRRHAGTSARSASRTAGVRK